MFWGIYVPRIFISSNSIDSIVSINNIETVLEKYSKSSISVQSISFHSILGLSLNLSSDRPLCTNNDQSTLSTYYSDQTVPIM